MTWAVLVQPEDRPPILNQRHEDWVLPERVGRFAIPEIIRTLWPMQYVPRSWNAWISEDEPIRLYPFTDSVEKHLDVAEPGEVIVAWPGSIYTVIWAVTLLLLSMLGWVPLWAMLFLPWHFTFSTDSWLFRLSVLRYDYIDRYYTGPSAAFKRR